MGPIMITFSICFYLENRQHGLLNFTVYETVLGIVFFLKCTFFSIRITESCNYASDFFFFFFFLRKQLANFFFFKGIVFIYLCIYLFMAVLGLRFCARAFSSCGERGPLFIAVCGPLAIAASLVAEHRLQTRRLSSYGSRP